MSGRAPQPLRRQFEDLQARLVEAEDTLDAIRSGSVDALVVRTQRGEQLFTLKGADQTYRALVEAMSEGAVTLNNNVISYCNLHFARMTRAPLERVMGRSILELIRGAEFRNLLKGLQKRSRQRGSLEGLLRGADGTEIPIFLSASHFPTDGKTAVSLVVTDITERKEAERARRELSQRILNAQELERQRVARDLHDGVNQLLSSARYRLSNSWKHGDSASRHNLVLALKLVEKAIGEVRLISRNLRPSELDDLGLAAALRSLTDEFQKQTGIGVELRGQPGAAWPPEVEMAIYRITQEAINNVARHADATRAEIELRATGKCARLTIQDDGKGLPARAASSHKGWGLKNMRERASLLGGTFSAEALKGRGTRIQVEIPLDQS